MVPTITRDELKAKLDRGDPVTLVETLDEEFYREARLPGAIDIPYEGFKERAPRLLPDKSAEIVVYCMNRL